MRAAHNDGAYLELNSEHAFFTKSCRTSALAPRHFAVICLALKPQASAPLCSPMSGPSSLSLALSADWYFPSRSKRVSAICPDPAALRSARTLIDVCALPFISDLPLFLVQAARLLSFLWCGTAHWHSSFLLDVTRAGLEGFLGFNC